MQKFLTCLICLSTVTLNAQIDSLTLPEVLVKDSLVRMTSCSVKGYIKETIVTPPLSDRLPAASLSEVLSKIPVPLHLKSYGPGSLATLSLRGHSAAQTDILLDGFSIRSRMNGVYDLSLLPVYFMDYIMIDASKESEHHNRELGGQINFHSPMDGRQKWLVEAGASMGSYQDGTGMLGAEGFWDKKRKNYSLFRTFYRQSQNDFPYNDSNQAGSPRRDLENAGFRQYGFSQNNKFTLKNKDKLETRLWYVNNHREIPPTISQGTSEAFQDDALLNAILSWERNWTKKQGTIFKIRYGDEHIYYNSPLVTTDSRARMWEGRLRWIYKTGERHRLETEIGHEYAVANVEDYEVETPSQHRTYLSVKSLYEHKGWEGVAHLREEVVDGDFSPLLGKAKLTYDFDDQDIVEGLKIWVEASRNYRRPTFNDLYWKTGPFEAGNPDLLPESGWRQELGGHYHLYVRHQINLNIHFAFFHSNVKDWILWAPDDAGVWTPSNIKKVRSNGIETSLDIDAEINERNKLIIRPQYQYVNSKNTEVGSGNPSSLGKQLIYTPSHTGGVTFQYHYRKFSLNYQHSVTGRRFITTDNSQALPGYHIANLSLSYLFTKKQWEIEPLFEIRNLYNHNYQVVADRPMPPLHFQGTVFFRRVAKKK